MKPLVEKIFVLLKGLAFDLVTKILSILFIFSELIKCYFPHEIFREATGKVFPMICKVFEAFEFVENQAANTAATC